MLWWFNSLSSKASAYNYEMNLTNTLKHLGWNGFVCILTIEKTGVYAFGYENNGFMLLSPMALIVVGIIIWIQRTRNKDLIED